MTIIEHIQAKFREKYPDECSLFLSDDQAQMDRLLLYIDFLENWIKKDNYNKEQ
jgi:hypothetical protein